MIDKKILSTPIRIPQVGTHKATITLFSGSTAIESREIQFQVQEKNKSLQILLL